MLPQPSGIIYVLEMPTCNTERKPRATRIGRLPTLLACSFCFALLPTVHSFTVPVARLHRSTISSSLHAMPPDAIHSVSQVAASLTGMLPQNIPFSDLGKQLSDSLDIGSSLSREVSSIPEVTTDIVLESLGYDVLVFLAASVVVTPLSKLLNITPILGYLILGAILGPHGLDLFSNSKADVELGDFGILFLLFSEGLEVTSERLKKLVNFLPLGFAQISLVTAAITAAFVSGMPQFITQYLPLDPSVCNIENPIEAVIVALAATLSTSAFIFPVLKERGWEEEGSGEAATSILLLQDLMVAPLLVLMPYLVGSSETDYAAIGFLTAKATIGFGSIMFLASYALRRVFELVTISESAETFVALCLLVAAGMGAVSKMFGLTDTAGAFAAGILLANTNYRAQIQADILPFKGILLGIFFMEAGQQFDTQLVAQEWPTILAGSIALLVIKTIVVAIAQADRSPWGSRLNIPDAIRLSLLLAGGGEFAFVVLALAEKLGVIPSDLSSVATAIVLITMGLTPLLGELAADLSGKYQENNNDSTLIAASADQLKLIDANSVVVCGYGEIGRSVLRELGATRDNLIELQSNRNDHVYPSCVAFDTDATIGGGLAPGNGTSVLFGDGANAHVIRSSGIENPSAIFVSYEDHNRALSATARLRTSFPDTPIYVRAATRAEIPFLMTAGATEAVVESDELPRAAPKLLSGVWGGNLAGEEQLEEGLRAAAASAAGVSYSEADKLLELFESMDTRGGKGLVGATQIENVLKRSSNWIATDDEIKQLGEWVECYLQKTEFIDAIEFCRLYGLAPDAVRRAFGLSRDKVSGGR